MAYETDITTPAQTSATVPFTVTSNGEYPGYEAWRAFDHNDTLSVWNAFPGHAWIKIYIPGNTHVLTSYAITGGGSNWSPKDFTLQGSNDDVAWTVLSTVVGQAALPRYEIAITGSTAAYTYYKLDVTALTGGGFYLSLSELELIDNITHVIVSGNFPALTGSVFCGGYVAGSIPPFQKYYLGNANIFKTFPALEVDSFVAGVPIVTVASNLPPLTGSLYCGATVSGKLTTFNTVTFHAGTNVFINVASSFPMLTGNMTTGANVVASIPALRGSSVVSQTVPSSIIGSFKALIGDLKTGAVVDIKLTSSVAGAVAATTGSVASISSAILPSLAGNVNGLTQQFAKISGTINPISGRVLTSPNISASLSDSFPRITGSVNVYTGKTSTVSSLFPAMLGHLSGYQNRNAQISGNLAVLRKFL